MKTSNTKAKRKLTEIDFSSSGCHIALVSKDVGGPANLQDYALVMKATSGFSAEFLQKAQTIRVTMELPDFLEKFFGVWDENAEVLAAMFGYVESEEESGTYNCDSFWKWFYEKTGEDYYDRTPTEEDHKEYIASRLQGIEILKSIKDAKSLPEAISKLSEETYLEVLRTQQKVEKAFEKEELLKSNSNKIGAKKLFEISKENTMKQEVEMVEKSQMTELQKAFELQKEALEKAQATLAQFEADRKQALEKARKDALAAVVKDAAKVDVLFKGVGAIESQEDFDAIVKVLGDLSVQIEKSELFKETGASGEGQGVVTESPVAKALKAQLKKSAD